jgi:hypothetical protein
MSCFLQVISSEERISEMVVNIVRGKLLSATIIKTKGKQFKQLSSDSSVDGNLFLSEKLIDFP